jgi:hypothetical protein
MTYFFSKITDFLAVRRCFNKLPSLKKSEEPTVVNIVSQGYRLEVSRSQADWANMLQNTPSTIEEMLEYDINAETGLPTYPTDPNRCI